jgi:endonuclease YncB( thermonuclease family)
MNKFLKFRKTISTTIITSIFILSLTLNLFAMSSPPDDPVLSGCEFYRVSHVIDGDTFTLDDNRKVRMIGVDTPETVDPRKDVQFFGKEAARKLKEWIEGKVVCLRKDIDRTQEADKYGRLLRYVWIYSNSEESPSGRKLLKGFFVNAELIKQGYAFAYTRYPFQYLEDFRLYERQARQKNLGLWDKEKYKDWHDNIVENKKKSLACKDPQTICPEDAIRHIGETKTVRFFVKKSYDSGRAVFLNSRNDFKDPENFTAVIFKKDKHKFTHSPSDYYWGKTVDVTGIIKEYDGRAEIILKDPSQIKIVE